MRKTIYVIKDREARTSIGPLMLHGNNGPAVRDFHTVLANRDTLLGQHPQDFDLIAIGTYDEESLTLEGTIPQTIATGAGWLEQMRTAQQAG